MAKKLLINSEDQLLLEIRELRSRLADAEKKLSEKENVIAKWKQAEENLLRSESLLSQVADHLPAFVAYVTTPDLIYRFVNKKYEFSFQRPRDQIVGHSVSSVLSKSNFDYALPYIERAMKGETCSYENEFLIAEGLRWIHVNFVPNFSESGRVIGIVILNFDSTERNHAEQALLSSETRFRSIIDVSPIPMALNDKQQDITLLNPAFVRTFGYTHEDIPTLAAWWPRAYPFPEYRKWVADTWFKKLEQAKESGSSFIPMEVTIRCKDGTDKILIVSANSVSSGPMEEVDLVVFYDITAQKRAQEELLSMNENLEDRVSERTSELKNINRKLEFYINEIEQFNYIASHDLREPLLTLTNFTQLIKEEYAGKLDEDGNKYIEYIYGSAARMRELLEGLLIYALLGKEREPTVVDCNKIVGDALADLDKSIRESGAKIDVQELPMLTGNASEFKLLFQNLLSNAIKFRKNGVQPEIKITAENREKEWLFAVEDNGIGIEEKNNEKIFIIYRRLHNRDEYGGTGIGLAHCKKIVELHGGKIWVEAKQDLGSIFIFTIPKG